MKGSVAAAVGSILVGAAQVQAQAPQGAGVVQWDIQKRQDPSLARRRKLARRGSTISTSINNDLSMGGYFASCQVGTPAQTLTLQLDTGSSDIWVVNSEAEVCTDEQQTGGCTLGSFEPAKSSSFNDFARGEFDIQYVDGSQSEGDYFRDVFQIGGVTISNMTMGLGNQTDIAYGLVGVGYADDEAIVQVANPYPNLPVNMVNEGLINTVAYSLWLNDLDSSTGNILFGGIDTAKYQGQLTRINIYPTQQDIFASFLVAMTSLSAVSSSGVDALTSSDFPISVVLDSGTTLSYLPTDLAEKVWKEVGAEYSAEFGTAVVPCSMQDSTGFFSFGFAGEGGPVVNVTMRELVMDLGSGTAIPLGSGTSKGEEACEFGIQNFTSGPYLLGDTFLRSAYVVYDLINNEIGLAATDFNATGSNVVAFPSLSATIPSATVAPNQAAITQAGATTTSSSGFSAISGFSGGGSAASTVSAPFGLAQVSVMGVAMLLTALGSGIFLSL